MLQVNFDRAQALPFSFPLLHLPSTYMGALRAPLYLGCKIGAKNVVNWRENIVNWRNNIVNWYSKFTLFIPGGCIFNLENVLYSESLLLAAL